MHFPKIIAFCKLPIPIKYESLWFNVTNVRNQQIYTSLLTFLPGRIAIVYQLLLVMLSGGVAHTLLPPLTGLIVNGAPTELRHIAFACRDMKITGNADGRNRTAFPDKMCLKTVVYHWPTSAKPHQRESPLRWYKSENTKAMYVKCVWHLISLFFIERKIKSTDLSGIAQYSLTV